MRDRFIHFLLRFPTALVIDMELDIKRRKTRWWTMMRYKILKHMKAF